MLVIVGSLSRTMQWPCRFFAFEINGSGAARIGSFCRAAASERQNEMASLEGMSEAFGSSAGADDQREAAREEERPQSLGALMRAVRESDKRDVGRQAMRKWRGVLLGFGGAVAEAEQAAR